MNSKREWKYSELSKEEAEKVKMFCNANGIKAHRSECYNNILLAAYVNEAEMQLVNDYIDTL